MAANQVVLYFDKRGRLAHPGCQFGYVSQGPVRNGDAVVKVAREICKASGSRLKVF